LYLTTSALLNRHASIILAWFNSSEKITSPSPTSAGTVARFAAKPDWSEITASAFLNSASLFSQTKRQSSGRK